MYKGDHVKELIQFPVHSSPKCYTYCHACQNFHAIDPEELRNQENCVTWHHWDDNQHCYDQQCPLNHQQGKHA